MTMYKENFIAIDNEIVHENPYHYPTYNNGTYCFVVECFDRTCNVAVHIGNSAFQKWLYDEPDNDVYNKKQALIDEIYNFEFNYDIKNDISMADIFCELLGDQMGFWDNEPNDWIYKITSIDMYEKVDLKLFQEMLEN
ncbi:MAG: hypothetical protein Tp1100DCM1099271_28 [Prokaryotic dsDNA virus sp.]|nr:MAG: hypothetical protein Tp1102SUR405181_12 [Prokaryotic dsDNA virus sp.]QDP60056.1 MAG: hypothetical protein Tp1100DCM1099271_28 [Prokaryotic dsDNA virus sp.]QDP67124.1 MAG: hypothetical protein Tp1111SUR49671_44 [Prokaryotic dsDNA virus sp.]|tara:strand:- start:12119 stop:12532 length:414 start_codon:yes stop_codon:yes gene_type:complete